jgi:hypothetical protein
MTKLKKYMIDEDTGLSTPDGPFRSYHVVANGDNLDEMLDDAWIYEMDQDGESMGDGALGDYPKVVYIRVETMIDGLLERKHYERIQADREYATDQAIDERKDRRSS